MPTINDLIDHAFQRAKITRVGQSTAGREHSYALLELNIMLAQWRSDGISHGLGTVDSATEVNDGALQSAIYKNLALSLGSGPFGGSVDPGLRREAFSEKNNLMPYEGEVEYDHALSVPVTFDIETGST